MNDSFENNQAKFFGDEDEAFIAEAAPQGQSRVGNAYHQSYAEKKEELRESKKAIRKEFQDRINILKQRANIVVE